MQPSVAPVEQYDVLWDHLQVAQAEVFSGSRGRLRSLAKLASRSNPVLNVGIGGGFLEQELLAHGASVYSVDPSPCSVSLLNTRLGLVDRARVGRVEKLPFDDIFFGTVVISEVMEHLTDEVLHQGLIEIARVLRPGGFIIGTVPAREHLVDQSMACPRCQHKFHRWGHYQSFDCDRMRNLLAERFQVKHVFEHPFVCWETLNWKGHIRAVAKLALYGLGVHGSEENIVFKAVKASILSRAETDRPFKHQIAS